MSDNPLPLHIYSMEMVFEGTDKQHLTPADFRNEILIGEGFDLIHGCKWKFYEFH